MSRPGYVDKRGNNRDRQRRRTWLLTEFDQDLGPGRARCHLKLAVTCIRIVDEVTLSVDRIEQGGTYARHNIQPACKPCQDRQGGLTGAKTIAELIADFRAVRDQWEVAFDLHTNHTYYPGIIAEQRRLERRGGRREVTDWIADNPPPMFRDWLAEWHAARREEGAA